MGNPPQKSTRSPMILTAAAATSILEHAIDVTSSERGWGGVLFLHLTQGSSVHKIVLKSCPDIAEGVNALFTRALCDAAGVNHPDVCILDLASDAGRALVERVGALTKAADSDSRIAQQRHTILESHRQVILMEYVESEPFWRGMSGSNTLARLEKPATASALGRLMAVDLLINNWDRLPLGLPAWAPPWAPNRYNGNGDNLLFRASDGAIIAVDTDMKRTFLGPKENPITDDMYVEQVKHLLASLRMSVSDGTVSDGVESTRKGFGQPDTLVVGHEGVMLSDGAMLTFQRALMDPLDRLAVTDIAGLLDTAMRRLGLVEVPTETAQSVKRVRLLLNAWQSLTHQDVCRKESTL